MTTAATLRRVAMRLPATLVSTLAATLLSALLGATAVSAATPVCPPPLPSDAATGAAPRDRGLLWRISRDGRSSWLYGTVHVGRPSWRWLGPRTDAALRASDVLALEIDPADPSLPDALVDRRQRRDALPPPLGDRLEAAYRLACIAPSSLAALHPLLQATTLTMLEAQWLGLGAQFAVERLLGDRSRSLGIGIVALETAASQVAALLPADDAASWSLLDRSLRQLEDRSARRALGRLVAAWEGGDLATLEDHAAWCECADDADDRALLRRLNDDRNPALADGIAALHGQGRRVFAAVGVLHMTGPQSLPRLLAARGFEVERIR